MSITPRQKAHARPATEEEREATTERLYGRSVKKMLANKEKEEERVAESLARNGQKIKKFGNLNEVENTVIERLYTQPLKIKEVRQAQLEKKFSAEEAKTIVHSVDEVEETTNRLYTQGMERKSRMHDKMEAKVYGQPLASPRLTMHEQSDSLDRLYTKSIQTRKERQAKVESDSAFKRKPCPVVPEKDLAEFFERLRSPPG